MKMCYICNRKSKTQEFVWENGKWVFREVCINPRCKTYDPYVLWKWK